MRGLFSLVSHHAFRVGGNWLGEDEEEVMGGDTIDLFRPKNCSIVATKVRKGTNHNVP